MPMVFPLQRNVWIIGSVAVHRLEVMKLGKVNPNDRIAVSAWQTAPARCVAISSPGLDARPKGMVKGYILDTVRVSCLQAVPREFVGAFDHDDNLRCAVPEEVVHLVTV